MDINVVTLEQALSVLGQLLEDRELYYEIVVIGGGSLLLLQLIERTTKDLDIVALANSGQLYSADPIPQSLLQAAEEVGKALELDNHWLNTGPTSLFEMGLPAGFETRLHTKHYHGLTVHLADRFDQICFKLYAAVDQGIRSKHFNDLIALQPTNSELLIAKNWTITHDVSEGFAQELESLLAILEASREIT